MSLFTALRGGLALVPFLSWQPFPLSCPWVSVKRYLLVGIFRHARPPNRVSCPTKLPALFLTQPHFRVWDAVLVFMTLGRMPMSPTRQYHGFISAPASDAELSEFSSSRSSVRLGSASSPPSSYTFLFNRSTNLLLIKPMSPC